MTTHRARQIGALWQQPPSGHLQQAAACPRARGNLRHSRAPSRTLRPSPWRLLPTSGASPILLELRPPSPAFQSSPPRLFKLAPSPPQPSATFPIPLLKPELSAPLQWPKAAARSMRTSQCPGPSPSPRSSPSASSEALEAASVLSPLEEALWERLHRRPCAAALRSMATALPASLHSPATTSGRGVVRRFQGDRRWALPCRQTPAAWLAERLCPSLPLSPVGGKKTTERERKG